MDEDYDSLALCDPMQRINCEVDSLPESCFDSGLSTLRDSNEYDSEVEYRHQRIFQRPQCMQENYGGDASDTDVSTRLNCLYRKHLWLEARMRCIFADRPYRTEYVGYTYLSKIRGWLL